jgi:hypothetical protein
LNEEIFTRAGISKDDRAALLGRLFKKTVKRIGATHLKVFSYEGEVVYSKPLVDHQTQGKAIDQALQLVGLQKQDAPKITVKATINLPDWGLARSKQTPTNVTPNIVQLNPSKLVKTA